MYNISCYFSNALVCVSQGVQLATLDRLYLKPKNSMFIYNPYPIENIVSLSHQPCPYNNKFSTSTRPLIVSCGRLCKQKNFSLLIRAFARLNSRLDCYLVIIGDGPLYQELVDLVDSLGLHDSVFFLDFFLTHFP